MHRRVPASDQDPSRPGLDDAEAARRLAADGPNTLAREAAAGCGG
jgi:hypothetical protein